MTDRTLDCLIGSDLTEAHPRMLVLHLARMFRWREGLEADAGVARAPSVPSAGYTKRLLQHPIAKKPPAPILAGWAATANDDPWVGTVLAETNRGPHPHHTGVVLGEVKRYNATISRIWLMACAGWYGFGRKRLWIGSAP
jgi:hypothetical protein